MEAVYSVEVYLRLMVRAVLADLMETNLSFYRYVVQTSSVGGKAGPVGEMSRFSASGPHALPRLKERA